MIACSRRACVKRDCRVADGAGELGVPRDAGATRLLIYPSARNNFTGLHRRFVRNVFGVVHG